MAHRKASLVPLPRSIHQVASAGPAHPNKDVLSHQPNTPALNRDFSLLHRVSTPRDKDLEHLVHQREGHLRDEAFIPIRARLFKMTFVSWYKEYTCLSIIAWVLKRGECGLQTPVTPFEIKLALDTRSYLAKWSRRLHELMTTL